MGSLLCHEGSNFNNWAIIWSGSLSRPTCYPIRSFLFILRLRKCRQAEVVETFTLRSTASYRWHLEQAPRVRVDCVCHCSQFEQRWRHNSLHLTRDSQQDLDGPLMKRWRVRAGPSNLGVLLTSRVTKNAAKLVLRDFWGSHRTGDVPSALFPEELVLEPWAARRTGCPITAQERGWAGPQGAGSSGPAHCLIVRNTDPEPETPSQEALSASSDP